MPSVGGFLHRLRGCTAAILVAGVLACLLAPGAAAAGTLDQQQANTAGGGLFADSGGSIAQTFTAGLSGALDEVDVDLSQNGPPTAPLIVEVRDVSGGVPGNQILAGVSLPPTAVPSSHAFVPISFAAPPPVLAGTQYAIVLFSSAPFPNAYIWTMGGIANPYPAGAEVVGSGVPPGSWGAPSATEDFAFKTYVLQPPVAPAPASTTSSPTGQRTAALAKCKRKHGKKRKRCRHRANKLPA